MMHLIPECVTMPKTKQWTLILALTLIAVAMASLWPLIQPHLIYIKTYLVQFRRFSYEQPGISYAVFSGIFIGILLIGLPLSTAIMLLGGVIYSFWEATAIITLCRLAAAVTGFVLGKQLLEWAGQSHRYIYLPKRKPLRAPPPMLDRFRNHEWLYLLMLRLAPVPDCVVNYSMGATAMRLHHYVTISLIGMVPFTFFCVWAGRQLGSVTNLLQTLMQ